MITDKATRNNIGPILSVLNNVLILEMLPYSFLLLY